jgi:Na+/phosphate symporter
MDSKDILITLAIVGTAFFAIMLGFGISWYLSNQRILKEHRERLKRNEDILSGKITLQDTYEYIKRINSKK